MPDVFTMFLNNDDDDVTGNQNGGGVAVVVIRISNKMLPLLHCN